MSVQRVIRCFTIALIVIGVCTVRSAFAVDPMSLDEAITRLEATLGKFNVDQQNEWQVVTDSEHRSKPKADEPEVMQIFKGLKIVGHPFRDAQSISFDEVWQWDRKVYDVSPDSTRTLTRTQVSHNVTRYSITLTSGVWLAHGTMLSNGVHSSMGKSAFQGVVKWHDDGFELIGTVAMGRFYAAGGKYVLGVSHGNTRYVREGDELLIRVNSQSYLLAKDPAGESTQLPDFAQPFGSLFADEYRSSAKEASE